MSSRNPRVSLAMIVRDEERCIARALSSAARLVDELVVVDTGSVDATVALAESMGAHVSHHPWDDDFAAARNAALDQCSGDLILMLDADEWVEAPRPGILREWARVHPSGTAGLVTINSLNESDGSCLETQTRIVRLIPINGQFTGRIHEQAIGHNAVAPVAGLNIRHDGYLPAQMQRKRGRNLHLLEQQLLENPSNPYLLFQLGREHQIAGAFGEASDAYLAALPQVDESTSWRDEIRARIICSLHRAGRADEAVATTISLLRGAPDQSAEVLFAAGNLFLDLAVDDPRRRRQFLPMARSAWHSCLAIGEPTDDRDRTPGCGSYLAADNLAVLCEVEGDQSGGRYWRELAALLRSD